MAATVVSASPPLVNPSILPFSIVSYDGSRPSDDDPYPIANVLSPDPALFHCSRDGRNFNLVLQYTPSITSPTAVCTVTHIVIHGPGSCTAPVQSGVIFSSLSPPVVSSYSSRYDNLTRSEYEQLPLSSLQADGAIAFFSCSDLDHLQTAVTLPAWTASRFLHLKLISAMGDQDDNIDIARIAVVGYDGETQAEQERPLPSSLLTQLALLKEPLSAFNRVCVDHMRVLSERDCCILWGRDPHSRETTQARTALHDVAVSGEFDERLLFFFFDHGSDDSDRNFAAILAHSCGCDIGIPLPKRRLHAQHSSHDDDDDDDDDEEEDEDGDEEEEDVAENLSLESRPVSIVIAQFEAGRSYHYDGPFTPSAIRTFISSFLSGSLSPYVRAQPRPAGDADPVHPGVTVVTGRSWQELVQDSQSDVLELLWRAGEEEDAVILRSVYALAETLAGSDSGVVVAVMQMRLNDYPGDDGAAQRLPSLRLLLREDRSKPLRPPVPPTPDALLAFLHARCRQPPSFPASSPALTSATAACLAAFSALEATRKHREDVLGVVRGIIPEEEEREVKRRLKEVRRLLLRGADAATLEQAVEHVDAGLKDWLTLAEALADGAVLVAEVGRGLRDGGIDALSEQETKQVLSAAKAVQRFFPDDDDEEDEDDEADATESAADGDADADRRSETTTSPDHRIDAEKLRAATAHLREAYSGVKAKLEAHQAELAAQSNGRVVKTHSASELSQQLVAASAAHQLTVVDFTAAWCGPCRTVAPVFGALSLDWPELRFLKVDVDECPDVAASFGIEAMPTFVFIRDGKEIQTARVKGANVKALSKGIELHSVAAAAAVSQ